MPIETATPEQVEQCVDGLLTRIRQLEAENAQLQDARAEIKRKDAGIKRLWEVLELEVADNLRVREALGLLLDTEPDPDPDGMLSLAYDDACAHAETILKGTDDD